MTDPYDPYDRDGFAVGCLYLLAVIVAILCFIGLMEWVA